MEKFNDGYDVGDILYSSWGWEQTNIDWYRVVKRTAATVWMEPLYGKRTYEHQMAGSVVPVDEVKPIGNHEVGSSRSSWDGKPIRRKLRYRDGKPIGFSVKYGWTGPWHGKPVRFSEWA